MGAPLLKPYAGVGSPRRAQFIVIGAALIAGILCLPYGFFYALLTPWMLVPFIAPIAVLLLITVWALPESKVVPIYTMERMLFVLCAALMAWPNYLALTFPGLPWITVSRLVGTPMVILLLISLSISSDFRSRLSKILNASRVVWTSLAVFAVIQALSIALSSQVGVSISKYVVHSTNETAAFLLCAYLFVKRGRAELWAAMTWVIAILVCIIGMWEFRTSHVLWNGHVPSFLLPPDPIVAGILQGSSRATTGEYRAQSVFSTSLGFSEFLALSITFPLHFAVSNTYKVWVRLAGAASIPFIVWAILDSGSRLGLLGFFLATMMYLLLWAFRLRQRQPGSLVAPTVILAYPALFTVFVAASFLVGRIKAKVWGMGQYDDSNQGRIDQWRMGMPKLMTHPFGHGIGTGAESLGYTNLGGALTIDSYYLNVLIEYGFLGFIAFFSIFVFSAWNGARETMRENSGDRDIAFLLPLSCSIAAFLPMKTFFAQDDNHPIVFMMCGIIAALIYRLRQAEARGDATPAGARGLMALRRRRGLSPAE